MIPYKNNRDEYMHHEPSLESFSPETSSDKAKTQQTTTQPGDALAASLDVPVAHAGSEKKHNSIYFRSPMPPITYRESRLQNRDAGDIQVHIIHDHSHSGTVFKHVSRGVLEATEEVEIPEDTTGRVLYHLKRFLIGASIATAMSDKERLTRFKALAVLSSDAISSVAYATEAILINLANIPQHLRDRARHREKLVIS